MKKDAHSGKLPQLPGHPATDNALMDLARILAEIACNSSEVSDNESPKRGGNDTEDQQMADTQEQRTGNDAPASTQ